MKPHVVQDHPTNVVTQNLTKLLQTRRAQLLSTAALLAVPTISPHATAKPPDTSAGPSYDAFAPTYDALDGGAAAKALGFVDLRQALLQRAEGDVLEVHTFR